MGQDVSGNPSVAIPTRSDNRPLPSNLFLVDPANKDFIAHPAQRFHLWSRTGAVLLGILLIVLIPVLILAEGFTGLSHDIRLAQSGATAYAEITNHRSAVSGGAGQARTYYLSYRFYPLNQDRAFTGEQPVSQATYEGLGEGAQVDVRYDPADPGISRLANDSTLQQSSKLLIWIGLVGLLAVGGFAVFQILRLRNDYRLMHSGQLLLGHVNRCTGNLKATSRLLDSNEYGCPLRGNYRIDLTYRFRTPDDREIRRRVIRRRNDLYNAELPVHDAPLAIIYLDDRHYKVL